MLDDLIGNNAKGRIGNAHRLLVRTNRHGSNFPVLCDGHRHINRAVVTLS